MNHDIQICPICNQVVGEGVPVSWTLDINGREAEFQIRCCPVDAFLCLLFRSLKESLWESAGTQDLLRRLMEGRAP